MGIIEVEGISKAFRIPTVRRNTIREHLFSLTEPRRFETLQVLNSISFEIKRGETLGIMGRNGSGKSTLLRIICGIYAPDRGRVTVKGDITPILELGIGWNPELDAIDNVYVAGALMGLTVAELRDALDDIIAFAELERFATLKLKHYSSGMSSRLAYAVAFHAAREILVLDEVFAVGDAGFQRRCADHFVRLKEANQTSVVVSHDPRVITRFCDRALLLNEGAIIKNGPPEEVVDAYLGVTASSNNLNAP